LATTWEELTAKQHVDVMSLLFEMATTPDLPDAEWLPRMMHILSGYTVSPEKWLEVPGTAWAEASRELRRGDILSADPPKYHEAAPLSRFFFDNMQYRCPKDYEAFIAGVSIGTLFGMADLLKKEEEIGGYGVAMQMVAAFVQGKTAFDLHTLDGWVVGVEQMPARVALPIGFFLRGLLLKHSEQ